MNSNNPLVKTKHNFVLDRKILLIDSDDRDIERWPHSSEFEIRCPQIYNNVESIKLVNIMLPNFLYNISEYLQTNKMILEISGTTHTIVIQDGYYKHSQLKLALQKKLIAIDPSFVVTFNELNNKYYFGHPNQTKEFKFKFDKVIDYSTCNKDNYKVNVFSQHSEWGLGYILGFDKTTYVSKVTADDDILSFADAPTRWIDSSSNVLVSQNPSNLEDNIFIYIELDKYNKSDELKPYLYYNNSNTNSGIINGAFAKIPHTLSLNNNCTVNDGYLDNVSYFQPPIDKIAKIKLKFRYHNGMLVDFNKFNISLSLEINQLRNEMNNYEVRTPYKI
jgi:hypothetical protein